MVNEGDGHDITNAWWRRWWPWYN